jgi:hypothetical protein
VKRSRPPRGLEYCVRVDRGFRRVAVRSGASAGGIEENEMSAARRSCRFLLAACFVLLGAPSARAGGKSVITAPLYVKANDSYTCAATNGSRGTVTNVTFTIRRWNGTVIDTGACGSAQPGNVCPFGPFSNPNTLTWLVCEVTSDQGARGLRVTFQNIDGGSTVSAP